MLVSMFQRSRPQPVDNGNMYSSPRKLNRSLQNSSNANFGDHERQHSRIFLSPDSVEVEWNPRMVLNKARSSQNLNCAVETRVNGSMGWLHNQQSVWDAEHMISGTELPSPVGVGLADCGCAATCRVRCKDEYTVQMVKAQRRRHGKVVLSFLCCLFMVFIAVILSVLWIDNDEVLVVPT